MSKKQNVVTLFGMVEKYEGLETGDEVKVVVKSEDLSVKLTFYQPSNVALPFPIFTPVEISLRVVVEEPKP